MAKTHRKRSYKAKPAVKVSYLKKMRDYRILPILTVALFLYLQYCACVDYGPPVKCTKLDPCRTRGFACTFKRESDFEGVCVNTEIYGLRRPWPYDLVEKWQKEKAEMAKQLKREKAAMEDDQSLIPDTKSDSDHKPADTPFQPEPKLSGGLQPEFKFSETLITSESKLPGTAIDPESEKLEIITVLEPPSKTDDEDDHSLIPDTEFVSDPKLTDTPFQPEPQFSGGLQSEFKTFITSKSKLPGTSIDPEPEKLETTTVLEPPSKTDDKESRVTCKDQEKIFLPYTDKPLDPDPGRQMERFTSFGGHVEIHKKGNINGWKMTEASMTPEMKAKMDRYQQVRQQQQKVLKRLFEEMEKIFYEQLGTTAEEREAAARDKRSRQLYMWKMRRDKNSDVKNTDETASSHPISEQVEEKADNIQQDCKSFGSDGAEDIQYGHNGNCNTVGVNYGHGFAEGPAIDDGNATTKFSSREEMNPSLDEPRFDPSMGKLLPCDPISTEGMPVIVASSDNGVTFQKNTSLTRVSLSESQCA